MNLLKQHGLSAQFEAQAAQYPGLALARIVAQHKGGCRAITAGGEHLAQLSGKLRHDTAELAQRPTVGDFVMVSPQEQDPLLIYHVLPRKSLFLRTAVGVSDQAQPVAANVDILFLCMSLNQNFNLNRLERYLSAAWDSGAVPVVLLTKADLCEALDEAVSAVKQAAPFADVITTSLYAGSPAETLAPYLKPGVTAAFIGSSGVGKSSLINSLMGGQKLGTAPVGRADKGRHTTTGRELFVLPSGGVVIDTPGMRELGMEGVDLSRAFDDIERLAAGCRFADCTHTCEPGCAVLRAAAEGVLDQRRLNSYRKLKQEAGYDGLSAKQIEAKKFQRMFRDAGGMKNARKLAREKRKRT